MKSIPNIDYLKLQVAQEKPVGKYGNLANYLKERSGVDVDDATLDKKLRTFFEDLITEILKNPAEWDRTRNINFMELYNYLEERLYPEKEKTKVVPSSRWQEEFKEMTKKPEVIRPDMQKLTSESVVKQWSFIKQSQMNKQAGVFDVRYMHVKSRTQGGLQVIADNEEDAWQQVTKKVGTPIVKIQIKDVSNLHKDSMLKQSQKKCPHCGSRMSQGVSHAGSGLQWECHNCGHVEKSD